MDHAMMLREERVRRRAFYLWIEAGRPEGVDQEFWVMATRMVDREEGGALEADADFRHRKIRPMDSAFSSFLRWLGLAP